MTAAKAMEYRITRRVMQRRRYRRGPSFPKLAERLITTVAVTALLVLMASYLQELLWVVLAASTILTIGTHNT